MDKVKKSFSKMLKQYGGLGIFINVEDAGIAFLLSCIVFLICIYSPNPQNIYSFIDEISKSLISANASILGLILTGLTIVITIINKEKKKELQKDNNDVALYMPYYFTIFMWILSTILNFFTNLVFVSYDRNDIIEQFTILTDFRIYVFVFNIFIYFWAIMLTFHLVKTILIVDQYS